MHETPAPMIGIDLGGTNIRLGVVQGGEIVYRARHAVGTQRDATHIGEILSDMIAQASGEHDAPAAIGIGAPGIVNPTSGVVERSPHYPSWQGFALRDALQQQLHCPVVLDNDANMIARGELAYGAARELQHCIMLTFGTGIGGALVINRQVFTGNRGYTGEVGHMVIDPNGPRCGCDGRGHWEMFTSASGLARLIEQSEHVDREAFLAAHSGVITPQLVANAASQGNDFALLLWRNFGRMAAVGIASLCNITGIEHFVIGGGIAAAREWFDASVRDHLYEYIYADVAAQIQLYYAECGDDAGVLGAASAASEVAACAV